MRLTQTERTIELKHRDANRSYGSRPSIELALHHEGVIGLGEASPLPGYSPDTLDDVRDALVAIESALGEIPFGPPAHDPRPALRAIAALAPGSPAARFAVQCAWLDARAQLLKRPFHLTLPGPRFAAKHVPTTAMVRSLTEAERARERGVQRLKVKIFDDDFSLAHAIRARAPEIPLRLDANGALTLSPEEVASITDTLGPCVIEEPYAQARACPFPLALDESLITTREEQERLAGFADMLILKPTTLGLLRCAELAEAHPHVVLTHTFEGPIARAAIAELALAISAMAVSLGALPDSVIVKAFADVGVVGTIGYHGLGLQRELDG